MPTQTEDDRRPGSDIDWRFGATGIADLDAPTVAEITDLLAIECGFVDTPARPRSGSSFDVASVCSRENSMKAGDITNGTLTGTLWRGLPADTDTYWDAFDDQANPPVTQDLVGCLAGFSGAAGVPAAGDKIDIVRCEVMSRTPGSDGKKDGQRFSIELAPGRVRFDVTIVA